MNLTRDNPDSGAAGWLSGHKKVFWAGYVAFSVICFIVGVVAGGNVFVGAFFFWLIVSFLLTVYIFNERARSREMARVLEIG